ASQKTAIQQLQQEQGSDLQLIAIIILTILLLLALAFFLFPRDLSKITSLFRKRNKDAQQQINAQAPVTSKAVQIPIPARIPRPAIRNLPKSFSNICKTFDRKSEDHKSWYIVGASTIGKSHIAQDVPCQDNHFCEHIGHGWGIAVSSDGAGSAANSHIGSEYVSKVTCNILKKFITDNKYHIDDALPTDSEWEASSSAALREVHQRLETFAKSKGLEAPSVACTLIAVIFSPIGLLVSHIGDGRAGFCSDKGEWKSILMPHKGEEANQTIFLTSHLLQNETTFTMSGVPVPECRVIREKPTAFTIMSDGCETHSFECSKMDHETNKWHDPNIPSSKFFDPLMATLKDMSQNGVSMSEANSKWKTFLEGGTLGLKEEPDDKTLILGVLT
ncbi:MAG TPA: PP2C family serine/threonine-protein phosphatase, partial [Candidatus Hodarchaeales archaeon]|nr:PP2C family serine/threonine-protein phosphatase [Candidatus Hodarchaeales archaeon]